MVFTVSLNVWLHFSGKNNHIELIVFSHIEYAGDMIMSLKSIKLIILKNDLLFEQGKDKETSTVKP